MEAMEKRSVTAAAANRHSPRDEPTLTSASFGLASSPVRLSRSLPLLAPSTRSLLCYASVRQGACVTVLRPSPVPEEVCSAISSSGMAAGVCERTDGADSGS